jgi:Leucine-rich repeat (LRR) protein
MALKNSLVFGLDVNVSLADVLDRTECLSNLNLDRRDLDLIRGLGASGVSATSDDFQAVSNLSRPVVRSFDRYNADTSLYLGILAQKGGVDTQMPGNLDIAGNLAGSAIRFQFLEGKLQANTLSTAKWGDISTSRVSSWSSIQQGPTESITDPILFGGSVSVGGSITTGKLKTRTVASPRLFDSEVPTHKIKLNINGTSRYVYAMKGIPLIFSGFFRNANIDIRLTGYVSNNSKVSYRIIPTDGTTPETYENIGALRSLLQYRSPFAKERDIEVYYDPRKIFFIAMESIGMNTLPSIKIPSLTYLNIQRNNFREFPDFKFFSPNLQTLYLDSNNFYQTSIEGEEKFNDAILNKLPNTLRLLRVRGCFKGSIAFSSSDAIATALPNLISFDISRISSLRFYPDSDSTTQNGGHEVPLVPDTIQTYFLTNQDFRQFPTNNGTGKSPKSLTNLRNFSVYGNWNLTDTNFSLATNVITTLNIGATRVSIPSLQNQSSLVDFNFNYNRQNTNSELFNVNAIDNTAYKLINCSNLVNIRGYNANVSGPIPKFQGNKKLNFIDLRFCNNLTGGRYDKSGDGTPGNYGNVGDENYKTLYNDTFTGTALRSIYIIVNNPKFAGELEEDCLQSITATLFYFYFISYGRAGGNFPNTSGLGNLRYVRCQYNGFTGTLPAFASSPNIYYIDLSTNQFAGPISFSNKSNLQFIFLNNNNLDSFSSSFGGLSNLRQFYASANKFNGQIPNLSVICPKLQRFISNNNDPGFSSYISGSFINLPQLQILDLSNNNLSQTDIDNILYDLVSNYAAANRGGVTVNLLGNTAPSSSTDPELYTGSVAKGILQTNGWVVQTD